MTEKRANEIFRTKYPEGKIVRRHASSADNKFWVTFKPEGKVYYYACSTYQELLSRFGFKIAYKHDVEALKDQVIRYEKNYLKYWKEILIHLILFFVKEMKKQKNRLLILLDHN